MNALKISLASLAIYLIENIINEYKDTLLMTLII